MFCAICRGAIVETDHLVVPTTDGQHVHLVCAECEAQAAAQRRTLRAAAIAIILTGLFMMAILLGFRLHWIVILALLLPIVHIGINRRWWYYLVQSARLRWRLRG